MNDEDLKMSANLQSSLETVCVDHLGLRCYYPIFNFLSNRQMG